MRWRSRWKVSSVSPESDFPSGRRTPHRVNLGAVDDQFIMKVWPGREPGGADIANDLTLPDTFTGGDTLRNASLVRIGTDISVGVPDDGLFAVTALVPAGLFDNAISGGNDRCTARRRPVDTGVHAAVSEDRMAAHAEAGTEAAVGQRIAQQELTGTAAFFVIVIDRAVFRVAEPVKPDGIVADGGRR